MMEQLELLADFARSRWKDAAEIGILWFVIYQIYRAFQATRGARILVGFTTLLVAFTLASHFLQLEVIGWILRQAVVFLVFTLLIIFHPEIRNALARLGSSRLFSFGFSEQRRFLDRLIESVEVLSKHRFGALFTMERSISLKDHTETGVSLDSELSMELAMTIFHPKTALHDGAVILDEDRIVAAACVLPISQKELTDRSLGLRHRAAIGITEETDAIAVVVSEETGSISIAQDGKLQRHLTIEQTRQQLENIFLNHGIKTQEKSTELDGQNRLSPPRDGDLVSD